MDQVKTAADEKTLKNRKLSRTIFAQTAGSQLLKPAPREEFDPENIDHVKALREFLHTGKWSNTDVKLDIEGTYNLPYSCLLMYFYHHTEAL